MYKLYIYIHILLHPQKDRKVSHHQIRRDLLFFCVSLQLYVYSGLEPECESCCDRCVGYGLFVNWYTAGFSKWPTSHKLKLIKRPPQDVDAPKEEPKPKRQRRNRWGQDRAAAKRSTRNFVRHGWSMVGAARNIQPCPSSWRVLKEPEAMPVPSADDLALAPLVGADRTVIVCMLVASMTCLQ